MTPVYIRKLRLGDHLTSRHWRNDPRIWEYTGFRPNIHVTEQVEEEWIKKVLAQTDSSRYAICVQGTDQYIGNVQLTDIQDGTAEFHIFIGDTAYWGKGVGAQATRLMVEQGFADGLHEIYLYVHTANLPAIAIYRKCGFEVTEESSEKLKMTIRKPSL
ncbi:GNAT family protein [Nemorincola caseinilytica]|uniref:GNAT family protein n=1 Tax=Nemorincola caseinilytica TaxID=2054315 RepID=A0ABP8NC43_9BACT